MNLMVAKTCRAGVRSVSLMGDVDMMSDRPDIAAIEAALTILDVPVSEAKKDFDDYRIKRQYVTHNAPGWFRQLIAAHKAKDAEIAELEAELAATDAENERLKHRLARLQDATRGENNETR